MNAIVLTETGGPDVMSRQTIAVPEPGPDQVAVTVAAAGINFIDTYHRSGLYPVELPFTPGSEGAGTVAAVGSAVTSHAVGDRVAWAALSGSYADMALVPAAQAVTVPENISFETAAATMLQGMTAHYLANDTFPLAPGDRCLVHAAAGGTGRILVQLAKARGAEVFATVGTPEKAELAAAAGADHVILYRDVDFAEAVTAIAGPQSLDVVYDGVGAATFHQSLGLIRPRGMMVTFGNASGPVEPISPLDLGPSVSLVRPRLWDYLLTRSELEARASSLFGDIATGALEIHIGQAFELSEAAAAHRALESRATTGKLLLIP